MKKLFYTLIFMAFSSALWSQTEKGTHFLGTSANFFGQSYGSSGPTSAGFLLGSTSQKSSVGGTSVTTKDKTTAFNFSPTYGYFVMDGLAVGAAINFSHYGTKDDDKDESTYNSTAIGPFVRYYVTKSKKTQPFVELQGGIVRSNSKFNYNDPSEDDFEFSENGNYFAGKLGAAIFLGPKTSLDVFAGYSITTITDENDLFGTTVKTTDTSKGFGLGIGFTILL